MMTGLIKNKKIRILFTIHNLGPGGAERYLLNLIKSINYDKFEPYICCTEKFGKFVEPIERMGIDIKNLSFRSLYSIKAFIGLLKLVIYMKSNRIQIVHNLLFKSIIIGTLAAKIAKVPVIINGRRDMGWALKRRQRFLLNVTNAHSDMILAVCDSVRNVVLNNEKVDDEKISVTYNGIDIAKFSPELYEEDTIRSELSLSRSDNVVGTITHLTEVKGNEFLVKASPIILKKFPRTKFLIVGDGPLKNKLENLCEIEKVKNNFIFLGERNDIPNILSAIDIYVSPSLSEGFSNSILEALAMGKAVVASNVGGNKEIISNNENGLLIEARNEMALAGNVLELLSNPKKRKRLGDTGRKIVLQKYDLRIIVKNLMNLYISVLKTKTNYLV